MTSQCYRCYKMFEVREGWPEEHCPACLLYYTIVRNWHEQMYARWRVYMDTFQNG